MLKNLKEIYSYRNALWDMSLAALKTKYSGAFLGVFWAVLNPLLITFAVTFVFRAVFETPIRGFPLFVLSGMLPWIFFSGSLSEASDSILARQGLLRQFNFPREILPLSAAISHFMNFLIGWLVMYPFFLYYNRGVIVFLPALCLIMLLNLILAAGLGLSLSVLNIFLRDISSILGVMLMFWFWVTPIFYSAEMVPAGFQWVLKVNPMAIYVNIYRDLLFSAKFPGPEAFLQAAAWAAVSFVSGSLIFSALERKLLKNI